MRISTLYGIWHGISGNRATTGCVHICCFKNLEKAGEGLSIPILFQFVREETS